jgi:hypothetical protein
MLLILPARTSSSQARSQLNLGQTRRGGEVLGRAHRVVADHPLDHPDDPTGSFWLRSIRGRTPNASGADPSEADQIDAQHQFL